MSTALIRAAEAAGGLSKLAKSCGASIQAVSNWRKRGVPTEHCAAIERAVCGAVMRWDLRPDDWHRIWPELVGAPGAPAIPDATAPSTTLLQSAA